MEQEETDGSTSKETKKHVQRLLEPTSIILDGLKSAIMGYNFSNKTHITYSINAITSVHNAELLIKQIRI